MPLIRALSDRAKGLFSGLGGAALWLVEWAGDKIFGDTVFGWARDMVNPLAQYEWVCIVWAYGIPLALAIASAFFFWRAGRVRPSTGVSLSRTNDLMSASAELPIETAPNLPRKVKPPVAPGSAGNELPNWQTLFAEQDDGTIQLKIYPDTPHVMRDAFCLLLFAYGLLKDMEEVPKGLIEPEMRRLMSNVPASPMHKALNIDYGLKAWLVNDFGQSAYEAGCIERVGLSTGIRYRLLWHARDECLSQARDLIRRA